MKSMNSINSQSIFQYNQKKKIWNGIILFGFLVLCVLVIMGIYLAFNKLPFLKDTFISTFINYIDLQISQRTIFGVFVLALVGGLFFVPLPMEVLYANFVLKNPNQWMLLIVLYMFGLLISYSINLLMGYKFSNISRKLISTKKFYEIKVKLNKYGKLGIFLANLIPFFPSQPVSLILGVFKYNKIKFFIYFFSGQLIKMVAISIFMLLF